MKQPRIVVLGAGSIGCFVGIGWLKSGLDVTLIGREWLKEDTQNNPIRLTDYSGWETRLDSNNVSISTDPSVLSQADLILLCVKCTATQNAAKQITEYARSSAVVVSFQNGISNVDTLRDLLPEQTVLAGMVPFNVAYLGNAHWHKGSNGELFVEDLPMLSSLSQMLVGTPWSLSLVENMQELAWGKLLLNLNNAINALSGLTLLKELSDHNYRKVLAASIREALHVLKKAGIKPAKVGALSPAWLSGLVAAPNWFFNSVGLRLQKIDDKARSSMADDFAKGRQTEIDFLNGEVVKLAYKVKTAAPVNEAIVALVKEAQNGGRKQWSGEDLLGSI